MKRAALALLAFAVGCGVSDDPVEPRAAAVAATYVGSAACAGCHVAEHAAWSGSHHALAMQRADTKTVLGDFGDKTFTHFGVTTRFRKDGEKLVVHTEGADGKPADFDVRYTFGVAPLQQYLLAGPGGGLQAFTVAWDPGRRRWFSLYPDERIPPGDALHWTGRYQSWNAMCADCHSTGLVKGYDPNADRWATRYAEVSVGCEACHGPGSAHVAWAESGGAAAGDERASGLVVDLAGIDARRAVESCAPCHSRRSRLGDDPSWQGRRFLDDFRPATLREGLYHADGQIDGEVYEYGSFVQSRMYARGVRCSDCHEPHGGSLRAQGDALCLTCHSETPDARFPTLRAKRYDAREHHFHPPQSDGARCTSCHMPEKAYMVIDPRRDHSLRIPRPDLSETLGTPNACNGCHTDRPPKWASAAVARWYGPGRRREPHFGEALHAARSGSADAPVRLRALLADSDAPAIARASALELLAPSDAESLAAVGDAARDPDAMVRFGAARALERAPAEPRVAIASGLLADPVRAVRIEAARVLAPLARDLGDAPFADRLRHALEEYEQAHLVEADLPGGRLNLAVVRASLGRTEEAERDYRAALRMDPDFLPARVNLANLLNAHGRNTEAEHELREALARAPDEGELWYSLGLLLAERERLAYAADALTRAAERLPDRARVRYNQALALERLGRTDDAERELLRAEQLDPKDRDVLRALAFLYARSNRFDRARAVAKRLVALDPDDPQARALLDQVSAAMP